MLFVEIICSIINHHVSLIKISIIRKFFCVIDKASISQHQSGACALTARGLIVPGRCTQAYM